MPPARLLHNRGDGGGGGDGSGDNLSCLALLPETPAASHRNQSPLYLPKVSSHVLLARKTSSADARVRGFFDARRVARLCPFSIPSIPRHAGSRWPKERPGKFARELVANGAGLGLDWVRVCGRLRNI